MPEVHWLSGVLLSNYSCNFYWRTVVIMFYVVLALVEGLAVEQAGRPTAGDFRAECLMSLIKIFLYFCYQVADYC